MSPILVREYRRAERFADNVIHVVGIASGVIACVALAILALPSAGLRMIVSVSLYASGLMAMLWCSALYNMMRDGAWKHILRRLDHAAIFVMIAGTYTPFVLVRMGGAWGFGIASVVWLGAITGIALKLLYPSRLEGISTGLYLALGWVIIVAPGQLLAALSPPAVIMLALGGLLYCLGIIFHLWRQLPYHNAIWHGFVLSAAGCHWVAIFNGVVLAA